MDEKYLQDLYSWIVSKDPSYQNNVTPEAFKQKMTDPTYVSKMHGWISSLDPTFQRDMTVDKFTERVGLGKKKVDTALLGEDGSSVLSKTKPQPEVAESTAAKPMMPPPAAEESKAEDDGQGWLVNTVSAIDRGFYKNLIGSPIKGLGTLLEGANRKMFGGTGKDSITDALISFGDYFNNTIDELAPQDEDFKGSLTDQFSQAFGQVASLVLTGVASAVVKGATLTTGGTAAAGFAAPKAVTVGSAVRGIASQLASPVSVSAGLTMGQNEFDRAKEMGATDDQAFEAFYKNAAVGSILEKIPVMQFMKRFNTASAGGLVNYIRTKGVAGLTGGLEEMTTEVLQQIYANKTAQEIYNANQELFEGVGSSGGVGFGVGFLLNAMGANARLLRNQGRTEEAKVIEDQIKELETQAERGGPSSYTFNGIKIQPIEIDGNIQEPRKVIEDMIDNMSAADLAKANIEITNDPELRIKLQEKIVTSSIKEQAREANPNLTEEQLDEVTNLEKELRKLEGNTTQIGKDKAAAIRSQIKTIQENAVQKQAAGEVPVQPTTGVSGEVAQGVTQAKPESVTEEGVTKEKIKSLDRNDVIELAKLSGIESNWDMAGEGDWLSGKKGEDAYVQRMLPMWNRASQLGEINPDSEITYRAKDNYVEAVDENGVAVGMIQMDSDGGILHLAVAPEFRGKGLAENLYAELKKNNPNADLSKTKNRSIGFEKSLGAIGITEAYNKAKQEGTNPELVSAVEQLLKPEAVSPTVTRVKVAPFFNTQIATTADAAQLRQSPEYQGYLQSLNDIGAKLGIKVTPLETIGGYENEKGERIVEISNDVDLENATMEQAEEFAALAGALAPQVQEATIAAQYLSEEGGNDHKANEYTVVVSDVDGAIDALKAAGITDFSINEKNGEISFIDVLDFTDPQLQENIGNFLIELESKGINYEQQVYKPLNSTRVGKAKRKAILGRIKGTGAGPVQGRENILSSLEEAVRRDAEFQGVAVDDYFKPRAGNRLFNKPIEAITEIANRYFQRVFGKPRPKYYGSKSLDEARAKRISDAFDAMKHDPNNPEVRAAYEALAKETLEQYKEFAAAGYKVEINNNEPYANSQEMIDDLRNNKRMKIFSTESGFGETKITDKQRKENPLLRDSGIKDVNGKPLLINDVFRAIHDFYGHAELGNSFGPKGEENAWNIHARMYSPEARKAVTTETRGQNSFVNFSGVNDRVNELREQARELRDEGLFAQARKKVDEIYEQISFADQKVGLLPEEFYQIDENDLGDADRIPEAEVIEEIGQELTEADLPGYDRMMGEIEGVIKKSENRGVPFNKIMENVMEYMKGSKAYENATDVQREALVRDIRSRFKKREKRAPSAKKILGQEKTMVTVDDYKMMINQIKMEARAAREAKGDLNTKRKMLADAIRKMASTGKIAANRVAALVNRIGKVNLDSNESVERLIDYAGKLFADAEYANKLSAANTTRSQIRKLSKNKDKFANLRDLGSKFAEIDPSMVEDIDQYNRVASLIKESIKGSTTRGADVKFANMVRKADAAEYINKTMEEQRKKLFDLKVAEVQELLGVDASELTYDQLMQMLESDKPLTKDNEKLVRSAINKAFDIYSSLIKSSVKTGKDLFTGEDVQYTANQKKVVNEFMDMDLNILKPKQALEAVDALMNFFQNQSIAKMESVVAKYKGEAEMRAVEKKGIKAKPISKYWSKGLGRLLLEQTANLNIVFERMFGGFTKGGMVEDAMGVSQIESGKAKAQAESNLTVEQYVKELYKTKPNGQDFNTAFNEVERNMGASMMRNIIGTEAEMKEEFDRRKKLIKESIEVLSEGNEQEVEKGKIYEQVYNKILKDSKTIDEVVSKVDKTNQKAIEFWQGKWSGIYDKLYDVALGVYNKVLDKDISFTPDRFSKLSSDPGEIDLTAEDMGFLVNSGNAPLYKKETGVLMAATRPKSLPKNPNTGRVNRYLDFSFDKNNANSYYDALVDINTAAPIRQVQSALNSDSFARMLKGTGDDKLLRNRIDLYVKNIRNKNPFSNDEFSKAVKGLNRLSAIGVGQALGGVFQPIKQVIPIAMNTLINAGGLDINSAFNTAKRSFINKSGYAIANRGIESQAQIESLNKMIDQAANSKPEKVFRAIEKANNWWLKNLLVRFDVAIARASWMTYYEQSLKKQGIDPSGIDYNTHEINEKAADYAQRQVDRQQNVSDSDLAGALLSSKDSSKQLFVKVLMPFASFRMNQSARLGSDLATLTDKTSTVEDKKIAARSLAGFAAEMVTFRALSAGSALLIAEVVKEIMGREDDEEKNQKKIDAILKGQLTSTVADVFSPAPLLDKAIQMGAAAALDSTQDALDIDEEDRLEIYSGNKQDLFQSLGLLGIAGSRANQLWEMTKLSMGAPYEDDFGRKKYLSEQDREAIGTLVPMAIVSNIGLVPSEVNSIIRSSLADAKRNASTVEGGKSREDVRLEERSDELSTERKEAREQAKAEKIKALEALRNDEIESDKIQVINDMIEELSADDKDKGKSEKKKDKIEKDEKMKELLQGYDNKSDMKRYDPDLYEENFGENSEYYLENKAEMEVEKELNKKLQEIEDDERGYTPAQKRTKKYKDRLKSFKSRYRRESESSN
jgi:GNAT superfamily N-acetyltransferase